MLYLRLPISLFSRLALLLNITSRNTFDILAGTEKLIVAYVGDLLTKRKLFIWVAMERASVARFHWKTAW